MARHDIHAVARMDELSNDVSMGLCSFPIIDWEGLKDENHKTDAFFVVMFDDGVSTYW
jgi:hypothetical protein